MIAASQIDAMACAAVDTVQASAAGDEHRITGRPLLRRKRRASAPSAPTATLRLLSTPLRRRMNRNGEHEQHGGGRKADGRTHRNTYHDIFSPSVAWMTSVAHAETRGRSK